MSDVSFGIRARTQFKWVIMMRTFCGVTVIKVWPKRDKKMKVMPGQVAVKQHNVIASGVAITKA
jgi:hypothetical protein